jgi:NADH pyrophosphatase NudC (nudix superfamily)
MEPGAIFLILAVIILTGLFISRPFFEPATRGAKPNGQDHLRSSLLAEQDRLITVLQELEFDHVLGKIPEDEFPLQRTALMAQGVEIMRKLDSLQPANGGESAENRLEKAIAARRADATRGERPARSVGNFPQDDDLEKIISARRQAQKESSSGFCPNCGKPVLKSDKFCPRCGANLEPVK